MSNKRVSLKDVADRAGVSYQTVSKVLNGQIHVLPETAERVIRVAHQLGYRPNTNARNLRAQRSRMIGYSWVPTRPGQANHILDMFLTSMVEEAEAAGYHLLPFPFREGDLHVETYRDLIDSGRVDAFVISSINYDDARARYLVERKFPFVGFGRSDPDLPFPSVDVDGELGLRLATEHLIARGHRRIAALAWPEESRVGNDRFAGYLSAMKAAGLPVEPALIARGEGEFEFALAATERWLALPAERRPTAIVALNDTMAIGAVHAGLRHGLTIGSELAVIGFDDSPAASYLWPGLTSVRQPIREVGHKCIEMLIAILEGQPPAERQVVLAPELIVRASA